MTDPQTWFTIVEAAEYTRQPVKHLREAVGARQLRHLRRGRGGKLHFKRQWLDDYMDGLEGAHTAAVPA
jgi:excisionase family DNA binding protein